MTQLNVKKDLFYPLTLKVKSFLVSVNELEYKNTKENEIPGKEKEVIIESEQDAINLLKKIGDFNTQSKKVAKENKDDYFELQRISGIYITLFINN